MMMCAVSHIPNIITLARLALTPLLARFILQGEYMSALAVFTAICLTDVSDGAAARALGTCSRLGAHLDVAADLLYVMATLTVLNMRGLAPTWFTAVAAIKCVEFIITSSMLKEGNRNESIWVFDGLGRCFSALAFLSPGVFCLAALLPGDAVYVMYVLLVPTSVFAAASSAARIARCVISARSRRRTDISDFVGHRSRYQR